MSMGTCVSDDKCPLLPRVSMQVRLQRAGPDPSESHPMGGSLRIKVNGNSWCPRSESWPEILVPLTPTTTTSLHLWLTILCSNPCLFLRLRMNSGPLPCSPRVERVAEMVNLTFQPNWAMECPPILG